MLVMLIFIAVGYILKKTKILPDNSQLALSRLELYVFLPAMNFYNLLTRCTVSNFKDNISFILCGLIIVLSALVMSYPLSRLFVTGSKNDSALAYERNIYKYALTFGNFGFMGNFIVSGIWGQDALFKYLMFTFFLTVLCNGWGLIILIPRDKTSSGIKTILKRLFTPPIIAILAGAICGLLNTEKYFPKFLTTALSNASSCMGPVAMMLAGVVMGGFNFKELISIKKVYVATALRLIAIPAVILLILKGVGVNQDILQVALIAFATPLGLNTVVFPAAYGGNVKIGASMAFVSHILSVITMLRCSGLSAYRNGRKRQSLFSLCFFRLRRSRGWRFACEKNS